MTNNTSNISQCYYPEAEFLDIRLMLFVVFLPSISLVGVMGNIITVAIFNKRELRNSNNLFLSFLAVCNMGVLITACMTYTIEIAYDYFENVFFYWLWLKYLSVVYYLSNAFQTSSTYFTVCATCERWYASRKLYPIATNRAFLIAVVVMAVCFAINAIRLFELRVLHHPQCEGFEEFQLTLRQHAVTEIYMTFTFWFWALVSMVVPFGFLTVMNIVVIVRFKEIELMRDYDIGRKNESLMAKKRRKEIREKQREATILLICVVSLFLICNLPGFLLALLEMANKPFLRAHSTFYGFARDTVNVLAVVDSSSGFFLYVIFGHEFRKLSKEMVFRAIRLESTFSVLRSITQMEMNLGRNFAASGSPSRCKKTEYETIGEHRLSNGNSTCLAPYPFYSEAGNLKSGYTANSRSCSDEEIFV